MGVSTVVQVTGLDTPVHVGAWPQQLAQAQLPRSHTQQKATQESGLGASGPRAADGTAAPDEEGTPERGFTAGQLGNGPMPRPQLTWLRTNSCTFPCICNVPLHLQKLK